MFAELTIPCKTPPAGIAPESFVITTVSPTDAPVTVTNWEEAPCAAIDPKVSADTTLKCCVICGFPEPNASPPIHSDFEVGPKFDHGFEPDGGVGKVSLSPTLKGKNELPVDGAQVEVMSFAPIKAQLIKTFSAGKARFPLGGLM